MRRRWVFWRSGLSSGGKLAFYLVATAGVLVGVSAFTLIVWLRGFSWPLALLIALAIFLLVFAEGTYQAWSRTDDERSELADALATARAPKFKLGAKYGQRVV